MERGPVTYLKQKRLKLIAMATRTEALEQPLSANHVLLTAVHLILVFGLIGLSLFVGGRTLYEALQPSWLHSPDAVVFELDGYMIFLLAWIFPSILIGAALVQSLLVLFPKLGNSLTAPDVIQTLAFTNEEIRTRIEGKRLTVPEMQELLKFIDLKFLARFTLKRLALSSLVVTMVLFPFLFLASHNYLAITPDEHFVQSPYWYVTAQTFNPSDIDRVSVGVREDGEHLDPYFDLEFTDGSVVDLWEIAFGGTETQTLIDFGAYLINQEIPFLIRNPGDLSALRATVQEDINEVIETLKDLQTKSYF